MHKMQNIKVAVDAIVFGFDTQTIYVLLIQQKFGTNKLQWALPGGLVRDNEALIDAVLRELKEETNVKLNYIEQFFTFGDDIKRDPRNRVVSVAYFGLVDATKLSIIADTDALHVAWVPIDNIPKLAFDHRKMITIALKQLKHKLTYQPIGFDLLPKEFLFSDLENLYCTILKKEIDRRNFRKKIMSLGIVEQTDKLVSQKKGRPAKLFQFNQKKYKALEKDGFYFEIK